MGAKDKKDNEGFYSKIAAMAEKGENDIKTLKDKSGKVILYYTVHESGTGDKSPKAGTQCDCHYKGVTIDGKQFDSSYDRGSSTAFAPNQVIKGWTEAMQLMVEGDKWEMYIPSGLGYGDSGSPPKIPGGSVLVFTMEILKIKGGKKPASRCDVASLEGCTDKEKEYIGKQKPKGKEKIGTELSRLSGMRGGDMKDDKLNWINARIKLLEKLKDEL